MNKFDIKVATIDLYNNEPNEGIRCIGEIVKQTGEQRTDVNIIYKRFDTRYKEEIPGLEFDIYISSGGPGSPFDGEGTKWEKDYFNLIEKIYDYNKNNPERKKYIFFICHSFQLMARFFEFGEVTKREFKSFGVMPFIKTEAGKRDLLLKELPNPFYAADIRNYQVINGNEKVLNELGAKILSYEFVDTNTEREPALAAVRISGEIAGTQFHPEADPESMLYHFNKPDEKKLITDIYGEERFNEMINLLHNPGAIKLTRRTVLPSFINNAIDELVKVIV